MHQCESDSSFCADLVVICDGVTIDRGESNITVSVLLCLTVILILLIWFGFRTIDHQAIEIDNLTKVVG
jgi:hypothetical protein